MYLVYHRQTWTSRYVTSLHYNIFTKLFTAVIRSCVTDGITIGRPCCRVHDCLEPLPTVKHRFCEQHQDEDRICVVKDCGKEADEGHRTCADTEHRSLEQYHKLQGKAMFQLKRRLERLKVSQPHNSLPEDDTEAQGLEGTGADEDEDIMIDKDGVCPDKPDSGNRNVRACFGRRRTHNEELCVTSCGVILGRATFYGSEAPNGVRVCCFHLSQTVDVHHYCRPSGRPFSRLNTRFPKLCGTTTTAESL